MKVSELMIGDWVYNALYADTEIPNKGHGWKEIKVKNIPFDEDWAIAPIPLTPKILMANGFILKQNIFGLAWWREEWVFKCSKDKVVYITDGDGHGKDILYVHELQHALRLCGLNELADNLKIE